MTCRIPKCVIDDLKRWEWPGIGMGGTGNAGSYPPAATSSAVQLDIAGLSPKSQPSSSVLGLGGGDPSSGPPPECNPTVPCHHCYLPDASGATSITWLRCTDTKWLKEGEGECTKEECPDEKAPADDTALPVSVVLVNGRHGNGVDID